MWTTEGLGRVAPRPTRVRLDTAEVSFALSVARRRAAYRRYSGRVDSWGRGLVGDGSGVRPVWWGTLGECAFAKWADDRLGVGLSVSDADYPFGDPGWDFDVAGYRVQVKTAGADYTELLVRTTEFTPQRCDLFVRAHWHPPRSRQRVRGLFGTHELRERAVDLCGWSWYFDVFRHGSVATGAGGGHCNYVLPADRFRKMDDLAAILAARLAKEDLDRVG